MISPKRIRPGAAIEIVVNGEEHHMEIIEVKAGIGILTNLTGATNARCGRRAQWWLPYQVVEKEGWLA